MGQTGWCHYIHLSWAVCSKWHTVVVLQKFLCLFLFQFRFQLQSWKAIEKNAHFKNEQWRHHIWCHEFFCKIFKYLIFFRRCTTVRECQCDMCGLILARSKCEQRESRSQAIILWVCIVDTFDIREELRLLSLFYPLPFFMLVWRSWEMRRSASDSCHCP